MQLNNMGAKSYIGNYYKLEQNQIANAENQIAKQMKKQSNKSEAQKQMLKNLISNYANLKNSLKNKNLQNVNAQNTNIQNTNAQSNNVQNNINIRQPGGSVQNFNTQIEQQLTQGAASTNNQKNVSPEAVLAQIEAMLYYELLKDRKVFNDDQDSFFSSNNSNEMLDMFKKQVAEKLSKSQSFGLSNILFNQLNENETTQNQLHNQFSPSSKPIEKIPNDVYLRLLQNNYLK